MGVVTFSFKMRHLNLLYYKTDHTRLGHLDDGFMCPSFNVLLMAARIVCLLFSVFRLCVSVLPVFIWCNLLCLKRLP